MVNKNDKLKLMLDYDNYSPVLADISKYYDDQSFVGDYKARMALALMIIRRKCVGVVSGAGSGKTAIVDAFKSVFTDRQIYDMGSGSDKSQIYKFEQINNCDLIMIPELQKIGTGDFAIELLKNLGEGKDFLYDRTENGGQGTSRYVIKKGKAIVYTKALENKYESDAELDRRFPRLTTDMSEVQNRRVINSKADRRVNPLRKHILNDTQTNALVYHLQTLLKDDASQYVFINPLADYLSSFIPSTFAVARTYTDHYLDLMEGVAFFNKRNRIIRKVEIDGVEKQMIFVTPEDCWQLHQIYSEQFLQDVLNIPPNGINVLEVLRAKKSGKEAKDMNKGLLFASGDGKPRMTVNEIMAALKATGFHLKEPVVHKILIGLMMSGYVQMETDTSGSKKVDKYILNEDISDFQDEINWKKAIDVAKKNIMNEFPDIAEEYIDLYCNTPSATDPWTGEEHNMLLVASVSPPDATPKTTDTIEQELDNRDDWLVT